MSDSGASDPSIVEKLKKLLAKHGTVRLKPCDSTEELLRKLDRLESLLSHILQEYKKQVEMLLQPCKEALIANELIRHSELDVRVSVASCISQIIRITAPDEPYGEDQMKEFFLLATSAFERLSCMSGRVYLKAVSILNTMSYSRSCVMMLDLELYAAVDLMFHLFLDGIGTSHPNDVFSNMENIMTLIIHNNVDNDEFLLVLVKIILSHLRRENQNVSPVSFQLAENTFKNCSGDLKTYLPEAVRCLDVPIEDYAEVVVSFFDAAQRENTDPPKDNVGDVSCPGEAGLAIESDLCYLTEGNETPKPKKDEDCNENRAMIPHCFDDPDKLGKSVHMPQEHKPEEMHIQRKRHRRPNSLKKAEEGYDPFWMLVDWKSVEKTPSKKNKKNINCPVKTKISKELPPKPAGKNISASISPKPSKMKKSSERKGRFSADKALEPNTEGKTIVSEDQAQDITVKNHSEKGRGSLIKLDSVKKSRGKTIVSEELKEDIVNHSEKGRVCSTKIASVTKFRGKTVVSEDLKEDDVNHSKKGRGSSTEVTSVKNSKGKTVVSEDLKEDIVNHSEKGQEFSVKESRGKTIVSEDLKEDIVTLASQCRSTSSKAKAPIGKVSKQNPKERAPRLGKRTRSGPVGEEVIGRRIKVWWELDQKFYKGTIMCFDDKYKMHQVDYDDGEIEILDLTRECWRMLRDDNLAAHDQKKIDADSSSSNAKKE